VSLSTQQRSLRRNSSLKQVNLTSNVFQDNVTENSDVDYSESNTPHTESDCQIKGKKEDSDSTNNEREEINISGCRRRIQNRPNKKNSKSKSFCEQRKLRSHSPLPVRKQTQSNTSPKSKVLFQHHKSYALYAYINTVYLFIISY
jgi:hypothetical protein